MTAPWMPTTYRPERCGAPLADGGTCQQREGHYAGKGEGHGHPEWWHYRDACPSRKYHADNVFGDRFQQRGYPGVDYIDGVKATVNYLQRRCGSCGLYVIWVPKGSVAQEP